MGRTRILFIISRLDYTGAARQAAGLVGRLDGDRFPAQVLCLSPGGPLTPVLEAGGVEVIQAGQRGGGLKRIIQSLAPQIVYTLDEPANRWGRLAAARAGAPVIISSCRRPDRVVFEAWLTRLSTAVICNSHRLQEFYGQAYQVAPHRLRLLHDGIDLDATQEQDRTAARRGLGLDPDAPLAVMAARFGPDQDLPTALAALKLVRRASPTAGLVLVPGVSGTGPAGRKIERLAARMGLVGAVTILEPTERMAEVFSASQLALFCSRRQGTPRALIEAAACCRPVVAALSGGGEEVVRDGHSGLLVAPGDSAGLAQAWLSLLSEPERAVRMGAAGRELVEADYSLDGCVSRLEEILVELAPRSRLLSPARPTEPVKRPGIPVDSSPSPQMSVVIPAFNEAGYIEATLKALAGLRARFGLEVIVSDDGSLDETVELARPLCDRVVTPLPTDMTGPAAARNRGAMAARSPLLLFIDADIQIEEPDRFFNRVFEVFADEKIIAASCALGVFPDQARWAENLFHRFQTVFMALENTLGINVAGGWCQIVRREDFLRADGYGEHLQVSQDLDLFLRLRKEGRVVYWKDLRVLETPRRYRADGLCATSWRWLVSSAMVMFWKKSAVNYRPERTQENNEHDRDL